MSKLKIKALGAAMQVGRAGILISFEANNILLDYGVDISEDEPQFPLHVPPKELTAVTLTHAHLDHSGAMPLLYISASPPLYTTGLTLDLSELLIYDFLKISKYYVPYEKIEVSAMKKYAENINYNSATEIASAELRLHRAGHIPGSSMIEVQLPNYSIIYTGDFNLESSCLLPGADITPIRKADILIMESTYAEYDHPPRELNEKKFVETLIEVLDSGGTVLIPAFAIGRAHEIICVLAKYDFPYPIYLDGMARQAGHILLRHPDTLGNTKTFQKAWSMVQKVIGWRDRKRIINERAVIVSPAGMLKGGAAVYYMEKIMENPKNAIIFVSFQIPSTPGRKVLETGIFESPSKVGEVKARIEWFDFSSHCGRTHLIETIKNTKKNAKIIIIHGEPEPEHKLYQHALEYGREAYIPRLGEEIIFK